MVGNQAVLPCSWKSRLGEVARSACHIRWVTPVDTVFELRGKQKWEAEEFEGRVEVPEERLESGDCSLVINDVQIGDTGRYESFMVVDGVRSTKTKVFIQGVKLSVFGELGFGWLLYLSILFLVLHLISLTVFFSILLCGFCSFVLSCLLFPGYSFSTSLLLLLFFFSTSFFIHLNFSHHLSSYLFSLLLNVDEFGFVSPLRPQIP